MAEAAPRAYAGDCSCIAGLPAIHAYAGNCSCIAGIPAIAPAFAGIPAIHAYAGNCSCIAGIPAIHGHKKSPACAGLSRIACSYRAKSINSRL
jgi:hypothetical protein